MPHLVTVEQAAERTGKSVRSIWRYVRALEARGVSVTYRVPGSSRTFVDYRRVAEEAASQQRGNPRHRQARLAKPEGVASM